MTLSYSLVEGEAPRAWILVLHGLLGSGANWRSVARKLVDARPEWGAVLVDLRLHGRSPALPPPHTLAAVAGDLAELAAELASQGRPVRAVAGHSFGGKSALAYRALPARELLDSWILDASPSAHPEALAQAELPADSPIRVVRVLREMPARFAEREEFVASMTARGFSRSVADWLAMNLERDDGGVRFRLDLDGIADLLRDYLERDLWLAVGVGPRPEWPGALHVVVGGRSSAVPDAERERFAAAGAEVAVLPDAGHWLNVDAGPALVELMAGGLPAPPPAAAP